MAQPDLSKDIEEGRFFAIISYIGFFCIISLLLKKDNRFALFHGKQGLALFVLEVATFILSIIPLFGWLRILCVVIFTLTSIWGIMQVLMGNYGRIPVVSEIADKIIL